MEAALAAIVTGITSVYNCNYLTNQPLMFRPRLKSAILIILTATGLNLLVIQLLDSGFPAAASGADYSQAVVAVRDHVPHWQKQATRLFSIPLLQRRYDKMYYLENSDSAEQHRLFVAAIHEALVRYDTVDIFLLAHHNRIINWLNDIDTLALKGIRLVYNCGCGDYDQGKQWKAKGVRYYIGHKGTFSWSPVFYFFFLKRWVNNQSVGDCIRQANKHLRLLLKAACISSSAVNETCANLYPF